MERLRNFLFTCFVLVGIVVAMFLGCGISLLILHWWPFQPSFSRIVATAALVSGLMLGLPICFLALLVDKIQSRWENWWERWRTRNWPRVCIAENNGLTAVVLKSDLEAAIAEFWAAVRRGERMHPGMMTILHVVPRRTILFSSPKSWTFNIRRPFLTGTIDEMNTLLWECRVEHRYDIFVPHSSGVWGESYQQENFPRVSLEDAYQLIHGRRRRPPANPIIQ
ncbi:MAG: hypothetical protein NTX55_00780 [Candidatus Parcubacteria bacterium]|nr:hypothetical protein [Candidatus Parcubacteria bacterium]